MRILLVTEDVPAPMLGGAGQHAVVLGNALIDAGHEVHLLGYRNEAAAGIDNGFRGPLHRHIDFAGARWHEDALGAFVPLARPHMARRLWRAIRELPGTWDVVHYHGHNPLLGTLVPAGWNFVHTLHDQGAECIIKTRFKSGAICTEQRPEACAGCASARPNMALARLSARAVQGLRKGSLQAFRRHKVVFVSEFLQRRYCDVMNVEPSGMNAQVLHNFVAIRARAARPASDEASPARAAGRVSVFAAGRIDAAKGFAPWLDALDDAALQHLQITIAGDGPELAQLRARHEPRGIRFLGWCTQDRVLAQLSVADVSVVPSVWDEPCATTVLEALGLGRSVLALRRGGMSELAQYGEPGQLRLFDTPQELAVATAGAQAQDWPANERAAVQARVPRLLAVYAAGAARPHVQELTA